MLGRILVALISCAVLGACEKPDSVELGGACKAQAECKDPADTCMTIQAKNICTMACDKDNRCPKGFACPVTDPQHKDRGSCLPDAQIAPNVVTVY